MFNPTLNKYNNGQTPFTVASDTAEGYCQWPNPEIDSSYDRVSTESYLGARRIDKLPGKKHYSISQIRAPEQAYADRIDSYQSLNPHIEKEVIKMNSPFAFFGVDMRMGAEKIIQKANRLPGIIKVSLLCKKEREILAKFEQHFSIWLRKQGGNLILATPQGFVEFFRSKKTCLWVAYHGHLHSSVRQTLNLLVEELAKSSRNNQPIGQVMKNSLSRQSELLDEEIPIDRNHAPENNQGGFCFVHRGQPNPFSAVE